jgi:hypothetical protein
MNQADKQVDTKHRRLFLTFHMKPNGKFNGNAVYPGKVQWLQALASRKLYQCVDNPWTCATKQTKEEGESNMHIARFPLFFFSERLNSRGRARSRGT